MSKWIPAWFVEFDAADETTRRLAKHLPVSRVVRLPAFRYLTAEPRRANVVNTLGRLYHPKAAVGLNTKVD